MDDDKEALKKKALADLQGRENFFFLYICILMNKKEHGGIKLSQEKGIKYGLGNLIFHPVYINLII